MRLQLNFFFPLYQLLHECWTLHPDFRLRIQRLSYMVRPFKRRIVMHGLPLQRAEGNKRFYSFVEDV